MAPPECRARPRWRRLCTARGRWRQRLWGLHHNGARSCDWHTVEARPLRQGAKGAAFAAAFAAERSAWAAASAGVNVSDPSSVTAALALACLGAAPELPSPSCPLNTSQLGALKELLASSYVPSVLTAGGSETRALPLSAEDLVAAVTTVYSAAHSYHDTDSVACASLDSTTLPRRWR